MKSIKKILTAEIIATGDEVLEGRVLDTNAAFASRALLNAGITPVFRSTVGDNKKNLVHIIESALRRADIVIVSGGLGPTEDDLTRQVCADVLGAKLVPDKSAQRHITKILARYNRKPNQLELLQSYIPSRTVKIVPNKNGTARGFICEKKQKFLAALSGVPSEFKEMLTESVIPFFRRKFKPAPRLSALFNTIGKSETEIQRIVQPVFQKYKIRWGITAKNLIITVSFRTPREEKKRFESARRELRAGLKEILFSEGSASLQETVLSLLREKRQTLSAAESCTGGLIADKLTNISGASDVFMEAVVTYSNKSKIACLGVKKETLSKYGAVSEETASEMAAGVRHFAGTDFGVSTTGIAGPTGATPTKPVGLVYVAVAGKNFIKTRRLTFSGTRTDIKERAANAAFSLLLHAIKPRT